MKFKDVDVIAPSLFPEERWNEAEVFGAVTWLWLKAAEYREAPIASLEHRVLPILAHKQFALFTRNAQPLGYVSWAYFDGQAETDYLKSDEFIYDYSAWNCGDRMWIINWFSPLGESALMRSILLRYLLPTTCFRSLYHKGDEHGLKVLTFCGQAVSKQEKLAWENEHCIAYPK